MVFLEDAASVDGMVGELIHKIQLHVMPRRIRCKEFFHDFDPLRCGRCTMINFARALAMIGPSMTDEEIDLLAEHYMEHGPRVSYPQIVNYYAYCAKIDEIFDDDELQENMKCNMLSSSPGSTILSTFAPNSVEDMDLFLHALHRTAALCKSRGVSIKNLYMDLDRLPVPNPSRRNPYRGGKITRNQFERRWPFKKEMSEAEVDVLATRYSTKGGDVHFIALHNDISEVSPEPAQPFPMSPLFVRRDFTHWSHSELPVIVKMRAKVVEKRVRLKEHFKDYDPLRKGYCSPHHVKTVFTIMNLAKEIDRTDFDEILGLYMKDGLFYYRDFCDEVDRAFVTPGLESAPLARIALPDASTTAPARRNTMRVTSARAQKIRNVEAKIRTFVRKQRVEMKPLFQDFDKARRGYVTRNQFQRVMATMNFNVDEKAINLLAGTYCDYGNHCDFNYSKFLKSVDLPPGDVEVAMLEMTSPHIPFKPKPYFNARGRVIPRSQSVPMLLGNV